MKDKFTEFMRGRYGMDSFSKFLLTSGIICLFLSALFEIPFFNFACWVLLLYIYFRMFSKNTRKRYEEELAYERVRNKVRAFFRRDRSVIDAADTHRIYKCPECRQKIRVPRGKGKIEITCPVCGRKFIKRT